MSEVKVGQVWRELYARQTREVLVVGFTEKEYYERDHLGTLRWMPLPAVQIKCGHRVTTARMSRFNGKKGGYELVADVEQP